jgi:hypothetical protein
LLPPVSLGKRLFKTDYTRLDGNNGQAIHPDGITLRMDRALLDDPRYVKLESIPRADFAAGKVADEWLAATGALPPYLTLKGPVYGISFRDDILPPVHLELVIPNDAEPYSLLDVYAWTGDQWQWVPSQLDVGADRIVTYLESAPRALGVVQAGARPPSVGMIVNPDDQLPPEAGGVVTDLYPAGLVLGPGGVMMGQVASFGGEGDAYEQIAVSAAADAVMVQTLLADAASQRSHISELVALVSDKGYAGLSLDYHGVPGAQREAFTAFVSEVGTRLHAAGLEMVVTVPAPTWDPSSGWDTAGYDWLALLEGAGADRLVVDMPLDPAAYVENGQVNQLLTWAVRQVDRYRLLLKLNAGGTRGVGGEFSAVDTAEALAPLNNLLARVDGGGDELFPGSEVVVELPAGILAHDPIARAYRTGYEVDGQAVSVWLPSTAALDQRLALVTEYHLGGFVLGGLMGSEMTRELLATVNAFLISAAPPVPPDAILTWEVRDGSGDALDEAPGDLDNPQFAWQTLDSPGTYIINGLLGIGRYLADLGAVEVAVVVEPTATPTPEPTATPEPTSTPAEPEEGTAAGTAPGDADAVIAGEIVNVREGPGTMFKQIGQLRRNTPLEVLAVNPAKNWIRISAPEDVRGWVYAPLCTIYIELADLPVEDVPTPTPLPGGPAAPPAAPPPVSGGGFELGGHIRSWNYLAQMRSAGMNWVKVQIHYGQDASGLIGMAHSNGLKIQLSALGSRDMVNQANFHANYGSWVAGMAAAGADAIEVWNEPNIDHEWPLGQISPAAYTQLLCSAYSAIKNANGSTAVISAAPAPTGYFGGCSGNGCDDLPWLQGMYNAGAANCMDYIGAHHNAGATSPSASSGHPADGGGGHHSWYFLPQTRLYYNTFGGSRKLFYTEMGYASQEGVPTFSDWFAWARGINNAQQAAWLAEAASLGSSTGMVRCIIVWNIDFARYGDDPQDGYAIIRPDGSCPACATLGAVMGR